jgi:replicative DNA helicase
MGKTAFIMTIARQLAIMRNIPVGIFSMEMSDKQLISRVISMEAQVPGLLVMDPREADQEAISRMEDAKDKLRLTKMPIDDTPGLTITELRSKARRLVREEGCKLIIVDYIQLMSGSGDRKQNREQDVSEMSRGLKAMAKELQVPVIALSQLSRAVEIRGGAKRPQLSDLRESGSLEQDADQVWFLYRPWYYGIREDEEGNTTKTIAEVIVAKNRRGPLRDIQLDFIAEFTQFRNPMSSNEWDQVVGITSKQKFQDNGPTTGGPSDPEDNTGAEELPF